MSQTIKRGRTLGLYGKTGGGKTTQLGEEAIRVYREKGKRTKLYSIDEGGYDSIDHLTDSIIDVETIGDENPWVWIQDKVLNAPDPELYGLVAFDSATGMGDTLLKDAANLAAKNIQVGQQKVFNLKIPGTSLVVGANNESQYGLIQTFMLDQIGRASRLAAKHGIDVIWTFGEHYPDLGKGESPIIGPKLVGKALTTQLPRFLRYTLRLVQIVQPEGHAIHRLLTQPVLEPDGVVSCLVNPRFPLNSGIDLPAYIEPASVPEFWKLIDAAQEGAKNAI
jgi:hypothetical protein